MELKKFAWLLSVMVVIGLVWCRPHRILVDTDVDTDDFFALFYLLKLNKSEFDLQAVTINANAWSNAGAAVNHVYDILYMMDRDDVSVGVGGEGGILDDGTIAPNVGGYLPLIEQGNSTAGNWRYRQAILLGSGGRLDVDTSFGIRRAILPRGTRKYCPLRQPTAQKVLIQKVSEGPINLLLLGAHTNIAIFLMSNPHLKKNIEHLYIMGGGVRSNSPSGCHPKNGSSSCTPGSGYPGNLFTAYTSNPYSEFNFFGDPFAAYQVIHSGIPITLVPLDATTTIPINHNFFEAFEMNQHTYEAQYCFKSLEMARDTWSDDQFFQSYLLYDSFTAGIAVSSMRHSNNNDTGENEFALLEYMNITVITSNEPYGISDGSNPFFDNKVPKFNLMRNGVHSGHVQTGLQDPFCRGQNGPGICKDGYAEETTGPESVSIRVATKAKPNSDVKSKLDREFFKSFLEVLNTPQNSGRFNFTTQFAHYTEVLYKPDFGNRTLGRPIVFDMDMSAGDFLALFYLLKVPVEELNLKAILVSPTGWANAATIDVVYDLLHMMGRDDIPVGLGDVYAMNQSDPIFLGAGDCKYSKSIPNGGGGFLDSDTLYGLARDLPRGPRRYTAENSAKFGAPGDTKHPELRQPSALEVWDMVLEKLDAGSNITILTNGPLTSLASIVLSEKNSTSSIQDVYIVGGHIGNNESEKGNIFTIPSNEYAEFNIFLDPLAAKTVFESGLEIKLVPLSIQRRVSAFAHLLEKLRLTKKTPEALFSQRLLSRLFRLQQAHHRYKHMETFVGEILGAVILASDVSDLSASFTNMPIKVSATGEETEDGQLSIDKKQGKLVKVLEDVDVMAYYNLFTDRLGNMQQTAVMGSFDEQRRRWSSPPNTTGYEKSNRLKS